jgi:hypothetical protein
MQAKHESSGSAVAEISLIRSTSSLGVPSSQQSSSAKRTSAGGHVPSRPGAVKRPKLSRSMSSMARMERTLGPSQRHNHLSSVSAAWSEKAKPSTTLVALAAGTDSDKENWDPDERFGPRTAHRVDPPSSRRPLPSGPSTLAAAAKTNARRRTFDPTRSALSLSGRANTAPTSKAYSRGHRRAASPSLEIYEDAENGDSGNGGPDASNEVARFMSGDVSPSKKGDVDAVAGLLSLSQGNWR